MSLTPSPQDWLVLQCPACGARMKSRRDVAPGSVLLCPSCRGTVTIPEAEPAREPGEGSIPGREHSHPAGREAEETDPPAGLDLGPDFSPDRQRPPAAPRENSPVFQLKEGVVFEGGRVPLNFPSKPREPVADHSGAHPEFDGSVEEDDDEGVGGKNFPRQERRVRIKRRRRGNEKIHKEVADWNDTNPDRVREAEASADVWDSARSMPEDYSSGGQEYVVQGKEGGPTKKVSRRRVQKGSRLFFQRLTLLSKYLTAGLGLLLAGVAVYGITLLRKAPPSVISPSAAAPAEEETIDRSVLTNMDVRGAEKAVRDFLAADGIEAKLPLVRLQGHVRPLMEKWYQTHPAGPLTAGPVDMIQKAGGEIGSPGYFVTLALPVQVPDPLNAGGTVEEMTFFSVEEIRKGSVSTYLVDWETSTGYQEIPLETFKSTMPREASRFRVFVKNADYYNHHFTEKDWHCVEVYYPGREFRLWGYIRRSSLENGMLLIKLESGWSGPLIAELQYPENPASRDQVVLTRMVHPSWYYAEGEEIEK